MIDASTPLSILRRQNQHLAEGGGSLMVAAILTRFVREPAATSALKLETIVEKGLNPQSMTSPKRSS